MSKIVDASFIAFVLTISTRIADGMSHDVRADQFQNTFKWSKFTGSNQIISCTWVVDGFSLLGFYIGGLFGLASSKHASSYLASRCSTSTQRRSCSALPQAAALASSHQERKNCASFTTSSFSCSSTSQILLCRVLLSCALIGNALVL